MKSLILSAGCLCSMLPLPLAYCSGLLADAAILAQPPSQPKAPPEASPHLRSRVYTYNIADGTSHLVFTDDSTWEAPNWSPDGKYLILNHSGGIYRLVFQPDGTAKPQKLPLPAELDCNNDKTLSPDGKQLAFSASSPSSPGSEVYLADADGSKTRQVTHQSPSYFHGWSPDKRTLAFVAQRNGGGQFDIYKVAVSGGAETQLTANPHHDDGPDYSPDGKWIYINSDRSGKEAVWRLPAQSTGVADQVAEMVVSDGLEDWFPHISPDGKQMVYIGYPSGTPTHNSRELNVTLKLVGITQGKVEANQKTLLVTHGGQGSMNVNSWAPDSMHFAYVSYEALP